MNCMARLHCNHLKQDVDSFVKNVASEVVDKHDFKKELVDKWSIKPSLADKLSDILLFMVLIERWGMRERRMGLYNNQIPKILRYSRN